MRPRPISRCLRVERETGIEPATNGLVEHSELPVRVRLRQIGIPPSAFYDWYQRYLDGGPEGLEDRKPRPRARWNRISQEIHQQVVDSALERTELSPRELACHFPHEKRYFLSESSVYHILKADDLIPSPAYVLLSAAERFTEPSRRVHELWQTDFTYLRVIGWGWYYLSTVMDDFSRYIIAWQLRATMAAPDVMETLDNVTPSDVYHGRHHEVLSERKRIQRLTMQRREMEYRTANAA